MLKQTDVPALAEHEAHVDRETRRDWRWRGTASRRWSKKPVDLDAAVRQNVPMPWNRGFLIACVIGLAGLCQPSQAAAQVHWTEVRSPHFRVVTDGSVDGAAKVADEFEQMRYVVQARFPQFVVDPSEPMTIFAARDEASGGFSGFWRPGRPTGYLFENWDGSLAVVRLDQWNQGGHDAFYDDYVHSLLELNLHTMPAWLDTGVSMFLAYTRVGDKQLVVGAPAGDWQSLSSGRFIPLQNLLKMHAADVDFRSAQHETFRGESWALVHYLTFGPGMQGGRLLLDFMLRVDRGGDPAEVFPAVFGDQIAFEDGFRDYLRKKALPAGILPRAADINPANFKVRALSRAEADFEQGMLRVSVRDAAGARALIEKALAADPKLAEAHQELGFLKYDDGDDAAATQEWTKAINLDASLYRSVFARAVAGTSFGDESAEGRAATQKELAKALGINPRYAPAYVKLAILLWWEGDLDGAYRSAFAAEHLEPARNYDVLVARLLLAQRKGREAAAILRQNASEISGTDHDEAVSVWQQIPAAERDSGPPLTFDQPAGVVVAQGSLKDSECGNNGLSDRLSFLVEPVGSTQMQPMDFQTHARVSTGFSDTLWIGGGHFSSFSLCNHAIGHPVLMRYTGKAGGGGTKLLQVDVLDELPSGSTPAATGVAAQGSSK